MLTLYITNAYRLTNKELLVTAHWYQQWGNKSSKFEKSAKQRPPPKSSQDKLPRFFCLFICKRRMANEWRLDKSESTWKDENALCIFMLWVFCCSSDIRLPFEFTLFWLMKPSKLKPDDVQLKITFFCLSSYVEYQEYEPFCGASKYGKVSATQRTIPKGLEAASFQNLGAYFWAEMGPGDGRFPSVDFCWWCSACGIDSINYQLPKSFQPPGQAGVNCVYQRHVMEFSVGSVVLWKEKTSKSGW